MKAQLKPTFVILAVAVTLLVGTSAVSLVGAASAREGGPCPASWYPIWKQPRAIQLQCSQLKQRAIQAAYATAEAKPRVTVVPPTPNTESLSQPHIMAGYVPDDAKPPRAITADIFEGYGDHLRPISSIWQVGVVTAQNHEGYAQILVYAAGPNADWDNPTNPRIVRLFYPFGAIDINARTQYDHLWICPRPIGSLTITGITGQTGIVSFTSSAGVNGTLNMSTGAWTFSPTPSG